MSNPILDALLRQSVVDLNTGRMTRPWALSYQSVNDAVQLSGSNYADLHVNRSAVSAGDVQTGSRFYETDRSVTYIVSGATWVYEGGMMADIRANAPADLGANDVGFLLYVTDFDHLVRWTGRTWGFCGGDPGNGYFADFGVAPASISGWQLCDGTVTTRLTFTGAMLTATPFTTPNMVATPAYRKSGAVYSGAFTTGGGNLTGAGAVDPAHIVVLPYFRR